MSLENFVSHLLHLDASARPGSVSRRLSAAFAEVWQENNPTGRRTYRDLAAQPLAHVDSAQIEIMTRMEATGVRELVAARTAATTEAERASWAVTWPLVEELTAADTVLIGLPMYNFSVPSSFKAWFDRVAIPSLIVDHATNQGPLSGTRVVVVTARGGAYGPGTPRAGSDFQEPYLRAAFGMLGLADDLTFVHAELTKSEHVPRLAGFRQKAADSLAVALDTVAKAATAQPR
ncbi:FMN-dependent NADH:quinone oxidoreductase [Frankia sp. Hr75.2]|nr:FMN-dependent NADH:quinone oxidoreductase [Frankia sp. Hr75.2]